MSDPPHLRGSFEAPTTVTARGANRGVRSGDAVPWDGGRRAPLRSGIEDHERVGGHRRRAFHDQRVHVDLGHGWMVLGDARERTDRRGQRRAIHGRHAAEGVEQRARPDPREHALDVPVLQGRHAERDVPVGLGEDPTDAEDDDGAVGRIALHADHELARSSDHPLNEELGVLAFGQRQKRASSGTDGLVPAEIQSDHPVLCLVGDVRSDAP